MKSFFLITLFVFIIIITAKFAPLIFAGCQCGSSGRSNESCVPNKEQCGEGKFACCWPDPPAENPAPENREANIGCNPGEWGPCGCGGDPNNSNYCNQNKTWVCQYNPGTCGPGAGSNTTNTQNSTPPLPANNPPPVNNPPAAGGTTNTTNTTTTTNNAADVIRTNTPVCETQPKGDGDCDAKITLKDAERLRLELNGGSTKKADFNGDTRVDLLDISIWMRNYAAKYTL